MHATMNVIAALLVFMLTSNSIQIISAIERVPDEATNLEKCKCKWTKWMSNPIENSPTFKGDNNSFAALRASYQFCDQPVNIECRSISNPTIPVDLLFPDEELCDVTSGLVCITRPKNKSLSRKYFYCDDYEIRVECCNCSEMSTINPMNLLHSTLKGNTLTGDTTTENDLQDGPSFGLPISIIVVIVAAILLVLAIVLCVVITHKDKKEPKFSHHYMPGDSYLQRPVSFTEVDLMRSDSTSSNASSKSSISKKNNEQRIFRFTDLAKAKLDFVQAEQDDEPDVVSSTKRTNHDPILRHVPEERRWLPDEHEQKREMLSLKDRKKLLFSKPVPPPVPPPPPVKKTVAFPDSNQ